MQEPASSLRGSLRAGVVAWCATGGLVLRHSRSAQASSIRVRTRIEKIARLGILELGAVLDLAPPRLVEASLGLAHAR